MATVRMSKALVQGLCREFEKNYNTVNPEATASLTLGDDLYSNYVQPLVIAQETLIEDNGLTADLVIDPRDMFGKANDVSTSVNVPAYRQVRGEEEDWELRDYACEYVRVTPEDECDMEEVHISHFNLSTERKVIKNNSYNNTPFVKFADFNDSALQDHSLFEAVKDHALATITRRNGFWKKRKEFYSMLKRFQTLNQAIKAWPQLATMVEKVDPSKMVTIHKRTERKKKTADQKAYVEENSGSFNSIILGSTLLGDDD